MQFLTFLQSPGAPRLFGDFQIDGVSPAFLRELAGEDDAEIFRDFPPVFGFFARDGGGGQLAIWLRCEDSQQCPVVWITSEGQVYVLGENIDDFLCLLAGHWIEEEDSRYLFMQGDQAIQSWVRKAGLTPYEQCESRLEPLNLLTLEFLRWFAEEQRNQAARIFPERPRVFDVRPGEKVGVIRLGASEAEVSEILGAPRFASYESDDEPAMTAFYPGTPYVVTYRRVSRTVQSVEIFARRALVRLPGGFEPLLARENEAFSWLHAQDPGSTSERLELRSEKLGLSMSLKWAHPRGPKNVKMKWVNGISVRETVSARR